jgi:Tfp pilus assembly protein PilO
MIRESLMEVDAKSLGLILSLIAIVVVTALVLYLIKPQYQSFNARSVSFEMLNKQVDDHVLLQRSIDDERKQINEMQLQLHGEAGAMPVNEMESYLVGRLQEIAWESGIELVGVQPGQTKRILVFDEISFRVDVTGEYRNLYDWLGRIGNKLGFMLVSNYEISVSGRESKDKQLNMNVTIVFYRAADK